MRSRRGRAIAAAVAALTLVGGPAAAQEPTPTSSPQATASPTPSPTPTPTSPTPTASPTPTVSPTPSPGSPSPTPTPSPGREGPGPGGPAPPRPGSFHPAGAFDTGRLVAIAAELRAMGWPARRVRRAVFSPFVVAGPAAWTNTWGAPRSGPAPGQVRRHEGQDVFCRYGDPVLAPEPGVVEFDEGGLGGRVARLHRARGGHFYFAHLSRPNTRELSSGDRVRRGQVIGFCGDTGNARGGAPHVHFGWYDANGVARDPMRHLVGWLRRARREAVRLLERDLGRRVDRIDLLTTERLFGDAFAPDRSELGRASAWTAGSDLGGLARGLERVMEAVVKAAARDRGPSRPRPFSSSAAPAARRRAAAGHTGFSPPAG